MVKELLTCGYRSLEAKNQEGQTAVHLACKVNRNDILEKLILSGANVNCRDSEGNTPLHVGIFLFKLIHYEFPADVILFYSTPVIEILQLLFRYWFSRVELMYK